MELEIRCSACGDPEVVAKIEGKYYCFKCGAKIVREHMERVFDELRKKNLL